MTDRQKRMIEICDMIIKDTENDIHELEGKPFTGKNVATQFGYIGAQVQALAKIVKEIVEDKNVAKN